MPRIATTTISDKKFPIDNNGLIDHYVADITSVCDYYPFGSPMDGRTFSSERYVYGFNGYENDNEIKGIGNSIDFGARIYDSRLGRFLSIDPLYRELEPYSPYLISFNNPICFIDFLGEKGVIYMQVLSEKKNLTKQEVQDYKAVANLMEQKLRSMNIDAKVEVNFSTKVMSRTQFFNRKGADVADSYILMGSGKDLHKVYDKAKSLGWEQGNDPDGDRQLRGTSTDKLHYVNIENTLGNDKNDARPWTSYSNIEKLAWVSLHEDGHPKFANTEGRKNALGGDLFDGLPGHIPNTIMSETSSNAPFNWTNAMIKTMQEIHGKISNEQNNLRLDIKFTRQLPKP